MCEMPVQHQHDVMTSVLAS